MNDNYYGNVNNGYPYDQPTAYDAYGRPIAYNGYEQPTEYQPVAYDEYGQPVAYDPAAYAGDGYGEYTYDEYGRPVTYDGYAYDEYGRPVSYEPINDPTAYGTGYEANSYVPPQPEAYAGDVYGGTSSYAFKATKEPEYEEEIDDDDFGDDELDIIDTRSEIEKFDEDEVTPTSKKLSVPIIGVCAAIVAIAFIAIVIVGIIGGDEESDNTKTPDSEVINDIDADA